MATADINLALRSDGHATIKKLYYKTDEFKDGSFVPRSGSASDGYYNLQKYNAIVPSTLNKVVSTLYKDIFKEPVSRNRVTAPSAAEDYYKTLDKSVDNAGMNRDDFMSFLAEQSTLHDYSFVVMDDYPMSSHSGNNSIADRCDNRIMPFFSVIDPTMINWEYFEIDNMGKIIKFGYDYVVVEGDSEETKTKVFTETSIVIVGEEETEYEHELSEIPIKLVTNNLFRKNSDLEDSTPSLMNIVNTVMVTASMDAYGITSLDVNCVSIPTIPESTNERSNRLNIDNNNKNNTHTNKPSAGNQTIIYYSMESSNQPAFMTPPAGNITEIRETKKELNEQMFMDMGIMYQAGANASSASKEQDKEQQNTALGFLAQTLKNVDEWMDTIFAEKLGFEVETDASYKIRYGLDSINSQLSDLALFLDLGADKVDIVKKETLKRAAGMFYKGEELKTIQDAIDKGDFSKLDILEGETLETE